MFFQLCQKFTHLNSPFVKSCAVHPIHGKFQTRESGSPHGRPRKWSNPHCPFITTQATQVTRITQVTLWRPELQFFHIDIYQKEQFKKKTMAHFWCFDFPHLPVSLPPCHKLNMIRCREAAPARFWFGFGVVFAKRIKISLTCDFFNSRFQTNFWKHIIFVFGSKHALFPAPIQRVALSLHVTSMLQEAFGGTWWRKQQFDLEDVRLIHTLKKGLQGTPRLAQLNLM